MAQDKQVPLERYLSIIETIAASREGLSITDIAAISGLPKPTVHRLTRALVDAEVIIAEGSRHKTLRIGQRLWRLLYSALSEDEVVAHAQIICDELARQLGETCYIVRLGDESISSIARTTPDHGYRLYVLPGSELPPHAASAAKAILAFQSESVVDRILREPLPALTGKTKTRVEEVKAELEAVRRDGYAICDEEIDENVMAYACPVHLRHGGVLFSVGTTAPSSRLRHRRVEEISAALQDAADRFSTALGSLKRTQSAVSAR